MILGTFSNYLSSHFLLHSSNNSLPTSTSSSPPPIIYICTDGTISQRTALLYGVFLYNSPGFVQWWYRGEVNGNVSFRLIMPTRILYDTITPSPKAHPQRLINLAVSSKKIGSDHHQWYRLFHIERIACLDTTLLSHPECIHA